MFAELETNLRDNTLRSRETLKVVRDIKELQVNQAKRGVTGLQVVKDGVSAILKRLNTMQGWVFHWCKGVEKKIDDVALDIDTQHNQVMDAIVAVGDKTVKVLKALDSQVSTNVTETRRVQNRIETLQGFVCGWMSKIEKWTLALTFGLIISLAGQGYIIWKLHGGSVQTQSERTQGIGSGNPE